MDYQYLVDEAFKARENAYVPYSHFKVGACCELNDGKMIYGANIENAAYTPTNCAERTAIFKGVSEGARVLKAMALVGDLNSYTYPCGICRQVISEFAESQDIKIFIVKNENDYIETTLEKILPGSFTKKDLVK